MNLPNTVTVGGATFHVVVGGTSPGIYKPIPLPEIEGVANTPQDLRRSLTLPDGLDDHEAQNVLQAMMQGVRDREPRTL